MKNNKLTNWGGVIVLLALSGAISAVAYFYIKQKTKNSEQITTLESLKKEIETPSVTEVINHKSSGAYMPLNYKSIKIDKVGNAGLKTDDYGNYSNRLSRINHSGLEVDLKPFRNFKYFLLMNEHSLSLSVNKPSSADIEFGQCQHYDQRILKVCARLNVCQAKDVVEGLAHNYAGHSGFNIYDLNIDETKINEVCLKLCRK